MDTVTRQMRSFIMSRIRPSDTKLEVAFRKLIWSRGIRGYRKNGKVPGRPDIYFPRLRLAVFIDGCFWHGCPMCFQLPKSNRKYWSKKIADNRARDKKIDRKLQWLGISRLHIREHQIEQDIEGAFRRFLAKYRARARVY